MIIAVRKVSQYGDFFGPHFPLFGLNTELYSVNPRTKCKCEKIITTKKSVFGHFLRDDYAITEIPDLSSLS